jgi:hypothetical protein
LRGMRAACTQTMTPAEQAMAGRSLTSKTFSSRQRAICLYERTCPHRRADYTARHHRRRRRRARLASLSGILRGEYPQPAHTPRLQPSRVGIYDLVRRRQRSDIDHASGSISFRRRPRASIKTGISRILRMRQDVDRGRLTAPPLHRRSLQKQPDRNREEFRTPLGVRKSPRNGTPCSRGNCAPLKTSSKTRTSIEVQGLGPWRGLGLRPNLTCFVGQWFGCWV